METGLIRNTLNHTLSKTVTQTVRAPPSGQKTKARGKIRIKLKNISIMYFVYYIEYISKSENNQNRL